jgi:uncharacterized protein (TIGR03083 family)
MDARFVADVFVRVRRDFVELLASLPDAGWNRPTRCADWTVHQVARHVRDVARMHVGQVSSGGRAYDLSAFDPRLTPGRLLLASQGETPEQTLADLRSIVEREAALLADRSDGPAGELWLSPAGRMLHPWTFALHVHWDAWLHLRDVAVPLGRQMTQSALVTQTVILYALLLAATPASDAGDPIRTTVLLDGSPSSCYTIGHDDSGVVVSATPGEAAAPLRADAIAMVESLMGRGPALHAVVSGPAGLVGKLNLLREYAA